MAHLRGGEANGLEVDVPAEETDIFVTVVHGEARVLPPVTDPAERRRVVNRADGAWDAYQRPPVGERAGSDDFEVVTCHSWTGWGGIERARRRRRAALQQAVDALAGAVQRLGQP